MLRRTPRLTLFPYTTLFRSMADRLVQAYQMAAGLKQAWFATGVNTKFPNDDSLVDDGSAVDGRSPLTGADVNNVVSVTVSFVAQMEQAGVLDILIKAAVNPIPH